MYPPTIIDVTDFGTIHAWHQRGVAPAYMRGIPSWTWQAALRRPRVRRPPTQDA